jgi:hypothetical protein
MNVVAGKNINNGPSVRSVLHKEPTSRRERLLKCYAKLLQCSIQQAVNTTKMQKKN